VHKKFQQGIFALSLEKTDYTLACIAAISILFSTFSYFLLVVLDVSLYAKNMEKDRKILRIRWSLLVFVPLEDLFFVIIAVFTFISSDNPPFSSFICIVVSVANIIFFHMVRVIMVEHGIFTDSHEISYKTNNGIDDGMEMTTPDPENGGDAFDFAESETYDEEVKRIPDMR